MAGYLTSTISFGSFAHLLQLLSGFIPNALDKRGIDFLPFHLTRQAFPSSCLRKTGEPLSISVSLGKLPVTPSVRLVITARQFLLTRYECDDKIIKLRPIVDSDGLIRAKTIVLLIEIIVKTKFPIVLPSDHTVVKLLIMNEHIDLLHAGTSMLMSYLRKKYWIINARKIIQNCIQKCVKCQRFTSERCDANPGILPNDRMFSPPTTAWWDGWWERLEQMVKQILLKIRGRTALNYEELLTVLCDCERIIKARPLAYVSDDVRDFSPLTPECF
ncbi:integrase catalytic domain-containing protein [Trichonephila inaurata madagascariensis]|uniref:Integrase catalytic domain-containing protein n=1 Tax=Trichonephila inaurata madagascariensis TaxID=2747483 RepID=A0A8X7CHN5_9ARAC|nr:integrase catalytic domain-containing protein [Trichonephila inaurata madagascariensis]